MINYYTVLITGKNLLSFFNKILQAKINIFNVKYNNKQIIFDISYQDYVRLLKINKIYEINIIKTNGTKKYYNIINKYLVFIIFFVMNLLLIVIYSNMIFKININVSNMELYSLIKKELNNENVTPFSFKKDKQEINNIKYKIKSKYKKYVEWIEIEEDGVFYNINIIERINKTNTNNNVKYNIVASKNGIIKDMFIKNGQIIKNQGDYISKGELIVSGIIKKNDEIKNIVSAEGEVYAEVWYKIKLTSPINTKEQRNKDGIISLNIKIFDTDISLFKIENVNMSVEKRYHFITNDFYSLYLKKEFKENLIIKKKNIEKLIKKLEIDATSEINKNLNKKEKILMQKTLKINTSNDKIEVEVFFKVYENIASLKEIET